MDTADLRAGVRAAVPILAGVIPFALVAGVAAVGAGLSVGQAIGMSVVVFAGASQLAMIELFGSDAALGVIVLTAVVINLRMLMYSASIAPHFQRYRRHWKGLLAYLLTDQAYAVSIARYADRPETDRRAFYLGIAATLWVVWQAGTVVGAVAGAGVPDAWALEFAVPLVFLGLLVPALENRNALAAGLVAAAIAVAGTGLPLNLGLILGSVAGVAAGLLAQEVGP